MSLKAVCTDLEGFVSGKWKQISVSTFVDLCHWDTDNQDEHLSNCCCSLKISLCLTRMRLTWKETLLAASLLVLGLVKANYNTSNWAPAFSLTFSVLKAFSTEISLVELITLWKAGLNCLTCFTVKTEKKYCCDFLADVSVLFFFFQITSNFSMIWKRRTDSRLLWK